MNKGTKILVTVGIALGFIFILSVLNIKDISGNQIRTILGTFLMFVTIRAIWKTPSKESDNGTHPLDKTN